ncbi:MAG: hypothetical protein HYU37_15330 [Acidobacteria bacterium]|nr:hypothetical protein [Acidobacteriota bacterium]
MRQSVFGVLALLCSAPALAQSHYVAAAIGGDIFRSTHVEGRGIDDLSGGGEAIAVSARVRLTSRTLLVPDVRLNTVGSERGTGWIVRPSVAVAWRF